MKHNNNQNFKWRKVTERRICVNCSKSYNRTGQNQKYCSDCHTNIFKEKAKTYTMQYRIKNDLIQKPYSGKGGNQKSGDKHGQYKTGIANFHKNLSKELKELLGICERCGENLKHATSYKWCVHHKDHNRANNEIENLELLCKRCHQLEHGCIDNLPNSKSVETIPKGSKE